MRRIFSTTFAILKFKAMVIALLLIILAPIFSMVISAASLAQAVELEILTPRPSSTILARHPGTHLVMRVSLKSTKTNLVIKSGRSMIEPELIIEEQRYAYLHFSLPLVVGMNTFRIMPSGESFELEYQKIRGSLPSGMDKAYRFHDSDKLPSSCATCHDFRETRIVEPLGIEGQAACAVCHKEVSEVTWQHSPVANDLCLMCHQLSDVPWRIGLPSGPIEDICVACHNTKAKWRSRQFIHGPMKIGGCTLCHNPHGNNNRYFFTLENSNTLEFCAACHDDKDYSSKQKGRPPYVHGAGIDCVACHDPHASDNLFQLKEPINQLCIGCHYQFAEKKKGHPVGKHPISGPIEMRRPKRELSCSSCHNPHGSRYRNMLIAEPMGGRICSVCHYKNNKL